MNVILASSSPRRRELMRKIGIPFEVIIVPHEEKLNKRKTVYNQCIDIAYGKAKVVYDREIENGNDDFIVIGSDTIVIYDKKIYGKPKNCDEAFNMLKSFSGTCHEVVTSLVLLVQKNGKYYEEKVYEKALVYVDKMSEEEIKDLIVSSDPYSKAGGYAIQEGFGKYVTKIDGDYFTIVGLPLNKLYRLLKKYM